MQAKRGASKLSRHPVCLWPARPTAPRGLAGSLDGPAAAPKAHGCYRIGPVPAAWSLPTDRSAGPPGGNEEDASNEGNEARIQE